MAGSLTFTDGVSESPTPVPEGGPVQGDIIGAIDAPEGSPIATDEVGLPLPGTRLGAVFDHNAMSGIKGFGPVLDYALTDTATGTNTGPQFDHEIKAIPDTSNGSARDGLISQLQNGFGPVFDHLAIAAPTTSIGDVSDHQIQSSPDNNFGPYYDHLIEANLVPDWNYGPAWESVAGVAFAGGFGAVIQGAVQALPDLLNVGAPPEPEVEGERNRIQPDPVDILSPGTYPLEWNPAEGRLSGWKQ